MIVHDVRVIYETIGW